MPPYPRGATYVVLHVRRCRRCRRCAVVVHRNCTCVLRLLRCFKNKLPFILLREEEITIRIPSREEERTRPRKKAHEGNLGGHGTALSCCCGETPSKPRRPGARRGRKGGCAEGSFWRAPGDNYLSCSCTVPEIIISSLSLSPPQY